MLEGLNAEAMVDHLDEEIEVTRTETNSKVDPDIAFLLQCFPEINTKLLEQKLKACNGDLVRATDELLNAKLIGSLDDKDEIYREQEFTNKSKRKKRKPPANKHTRDIARLATTLDISEENAKDIYHANDDSLTKAILSQNPNSSYATMIKPELSFAQATKPPSKPVSYAQEFTDYSKPLSIEEQRELLIKADTLDVKRQEAASKMREYTRKARSNALYRSAAGIYAQQAAEYGAQSRSASDAVYYEQIEEQSSDYTVDCHGIPAHIATNYVLSRLHRWSASPVARRKPFTVITGAGTHSAGGVSKIKNMVRKRLTESGYQYSEENSYFIVKK
ncbi:hypothetical protein TRVA0_031S01486 [Trichomonascus vanleenenianus]|uniref:Cue2p n=1 Tax=Trichomonascus vanleenenianus TaxID=2268995 RepID=UPI003ECB318D